MIKIISDDACDLTKEEVEKYDIDIVHFKISDEDGNDIENVEKLYEMELNNPKMRFFSACPSVDEYYQLFKTYAEKGCDIISVAISAKFSGSHNSACVAAQMIQEEFKNIKIMAVDSMKNSATQGLFVINLARLAQSGKSFEEIKKYIEDDPDSGKILFTVGNLNYLIAGGRIGKLKGLVANKLNIKPIITMKDGVLASGGFGIGIKNALNKLIDMAKSYFEKTKQNIKEFMFCVGFGCERAEGENFLKLCKEKLGLCDDQIKMNQIGATTIVHTGPHTYGFAFMKNV